MLAGFRYRRVRCLISKRIESQAAMAGKAILAGYSTSFA